jgi:hypothetical protein
MERAETIIDIRRHTTITITRASQKWWRNLVANMDRERERKEVELTRSVLLKVGPAYWVFGVDAQLTERERATERERERECEREKGE